MTIFQVVLASFFIGLMAQIKVPLYFTPVPFTIQTTSIMLVAALLGKQKSTVAVLCYLFQGCMGLPVWAGGHSGFLHFMGPTGGYLMAYVAQSYFIGWFLEQHPSKYKAFLLSIFIQLGLGSLWLAPFVGLNNCFHLGFNPFFLTEVIKALLLANLLHRRSA